MITGSYLNLTSCGKELNRTSYDCNYSEFDLSKRQKTYVNYLEVIVNSSGKVMYAVPSHQEKLVSIAMEYLGVSREELWGMCPPDYYFEWRNEN